MKNTASEQPTLFEFLNENEISTDPIVDDTQKAVSKYVRKTTKEEFKEIAKNNLQKKQYDLFYTAPIRQNDKTPRILTDIRPVNQFANYLPKTTSRIIHGIKITATNLKEAEYYLQNGSNIKDIIANETKRMDAINALEKWKLSNYKLAINDLCRGLIRQLSKGVQFEGVKPQFIENQNGEKIITSWLVTMNWRQVKLTTFGGLVDQYGNYKRGTSDILKHTTEKELINFINQKTPPALLQYFFKTKDGFHTFGEYAPIRIFDRNNYLVTFELDRRYFPFDFTDKGEPCGIAKNSRYIIDIAGSSSVFAIGHYHLQQQNIDGLPSALVANRFYQALMGAFQFQNLLGMSLRNTYTDKENIAVRKRGVYIMLKDEQGKEKRMTQLEYQQFETKKRTGAQITINRNNSVLEYDLFTKDIEKRQWGNVQRKGKLIGDMLLDGLRTTGLLDELKNDPTAKNILIPSNQTGMQYLEEYPNLLLAKVEPLSNLK